MSTNLEESRVSTGEQEDGPPTTNDAEDVSRQEAIKQIKRRSNFHIELVISGIGTAILVLIWATTEYHNAGGWPTQGFSQSFGIHDVWNYWLIYPVGAWVLIMVGRAWSVYRHRGISESEIEREIDRQASRR